MRAYSILQALANNDSFLTISFFADMLNVSKRTIQKELSYLRKEGPEHGYVFLNSYGKGYSVEVTDANLFRAFLNELDSEPESIKISKLINDELKILISQGEQYTSVATLAENLAISKTLIYEKNNDLAKYLNSYNLLLERKSHFGIRIKGSSTDIRKLIMDLYTKGENFKEYTNKYVDDFDQYESLFEKKIRQSSLKIGYHEFRFLVAWLKAIILYKSFFNKKDAVRYQRKTELSVFAELIAQVERDFSIELDNDERGEFKELINSFSQNNGVVKKHHLENLKEYLKVFFKKIDKKSQTDYSSDQEFLNNLLKHLKFLINRLDQDITYKNPLLLELCIEYSMVFDEVLELSNFLKNKLGYHISNDELGFIAVHFLNHIEKEKSKKINQYRKVAVICTTGGGVSTFIKNKIVSIFPDSEIRTFSFWGMEDIKNFCPDIIFTVVPLKDSFNIPIVYVNELLTDKELEDIRRMLFLESNPHKLKVKEKFNPYVSLLKQEFFKIENNVSYERIIKDMATELVCKGYANEDFVNNVLLREEYMSTVYINGIAMPHPIEMNAKESVISIRIIKPTLQESGKSIKIIFMICLSKKDFNYYSSISSGIYKIMRNKAVLSDIYNQTDFYKVKSLIKKLGE